MSDLDGQEKTDSLDTVVAPVYVVTCINTWMGGQHIRYHRIKFTHEEIVGVGTAPAHPEELQQIIELTVHVSTHCHGGAGGREIADMRCGVVWYLTDLTCLTLLSCTRMSLAAEQRFLTLSSDRRRQL